MSSASRFAFFCAGFAAACAPAHSKGISVRFLANPSGDSVVKYAVMRADGPGQAPVQVGEVGDAGKDGAAANDTLTFPDTAAVKGRAYLYSIVALDAEGGASDPSEPTEVASPSLGLPDTLRGDAAGARWTLPAGSDPLSGSAPLALSLEDTARFSLRYDSAAHQLVFESRGETRSGWAQVRAVYFGKFVDRDSVWIDFAPGALARPGRASASADIGLPSSWSPRLGAMRIRLSPLTGVNGMNGASGGNSPRSLEILTARGQSVAAIPLPAGGADAFWDGRDRQGRALDPACYLWAARDGRGSLRRSGALRILP